VAARRSTRGSRSSGGIHDESMYAPVMTPRSLSGVGPRVAESGLGLIDGLFGSAPYEDLTLKAR
jgi:peptide/nickel transport system substrate-binding protein